MATVDLHSTAQDLEAAGADPQLAIATVSTPSRPAWQAISRACRSA